MADLLYLGPDGTFTHRAAGDLARGGERLVPCTTVDEAVVGVADGTAGAAVVAFENSLEGAVVANLDLLLFATRDVVIAAERVLPVAFTLWRRPDDDAPLAGVASHPFAIAQCSDLVRSRGLRTRTTTSTAAACAELGEAAAPGWGALAPPDAGVAHGLVAVEDGLRDDERAATRFLRLERACPPPSGRDRSAFAVQPRSDEPGSLVRILQEFSVRGINLTTIKSRPAKSELGDYVFYFECAGHLAEPRVADAALGLLRMPGETRYLGSFAEDPSRADPGGPRDGGAAGDEDAAARRLRELLALSGSA